MALLKTAAGLVAQGRSMAAQGKLDEAVPVLRAALKTAEVAKGST